MSAEILDISSATSPFLEQGTTTATASQKSVITDCIIKIKSRYSIELEDYHLESTFFSYLTAGDAVQKIADGLIKPVAVFVEPDADAETLKDLYNVLALHCIPYILFTGKFDPDARMKAVTLKVDDYMFGAVNNDLLRRVETIRKLKIYKANRENLSVASRSKAVPRVRLWRLKRTMDFAAALVALLLLSPLLILIAIIIKLESRGPVFYISKRAGSGYKIFDFYKFRSMRVGADAELKKFAALNQYGEGNSVFFKIKNDPRITKFGMFLRKTSLDEIPQLINVLKGDMSLVGNRPLPLYEAERLTKDQIAWRFLAPAGLTGLWQITKRGKDDMSPEERIQLDMEYAMNNSFWGDMKIILKTFPALLQKEKV